MIELKNITKIYPNGFQAIKNLDLYVEKGDIMGIIGYSGAGKSTLIRLINRLELPSSGKVIVDKQNILALCESELQKTRQKIGMIFQHFNLLESRNVFGNIAFALEIAKWKKDSIKERVKELLQLVGLEDKASFYPSQLSGGQKQRVAIARALANSPKILLCDEATSALDTKTTKSILNLLHELQQKLHLTILLITHQIEVVREICNNMCVMSAGEIIEYGRVEAVFASPKHEVTKELISYLPALSSEEILKQTHKQIYKISFIGQYIHDPLISEIVKKFGVSVNILAGNIEALSHTEIGHLFIAFDDNQEANIKAINYLQEKGVLVEKIDS
ncbi:methionine ABC transporter ATP-binding protein [Helicobacter didelphidarum]|uniref:Cell division ATP-binding protein FtsE n=1 Tax=Helicobacter didelphidarum TaxID=2040648 RepID=A0A3D8IIF0_9HELI|nr:ATP-binding cassette domain-containing protein [Helicobacter didelphidarum]RDU64908.1 methionine ABC transporter ATP-binding protein [Helicobacter didelphidarum]